MSSQQQNPPREFFQGLTGVFYAGLIILFVVIPMACLIGVCLYVIAAFSVVGH